MEVIKSAVKGKKGFTKGVSGNPGGRVKGKPTHYTRKMSGLMKLAADRADEAFSLLWDAMQAKEGWAHQIYFKELLSKKIKQETVLLENKGSGVDKQIEALQEGLIKFDEVTEDEAQTRLRTLTATRIVDNVELQTSEIRYTRDNLLGIIDKLDKVIDTKKDDEEEGEE